MRRFSLRVIFALLMQGAFASAPALAQTGPAPARMVIVAMPKPTPKPETSVSLSVPLDLEIAPDGRVTQVSILESSGDTKFDEKVRKYYSKFRLVPALDGHGKPVTSVFRFMYKFAPDGSTEVPLPPTRMAGSPQSETISTGGIAQAQVFDEVERISRMRCKDFLWEFDLMKQIAGAKPIYDERMLRTSLGMFIVQKSVKDDELNGISMAFSQGVREVVNECRKRPDAKYFLDVLVPALERKLDR